MKQKLLLKFAAAALLALSLFSFSYVNLHSGCKNASQCEKGKEKVQAVLVEEEDNKSTELPLPDITLISKAVKVVQRLTSSN